MRDTVFSVLKMIAKTSLVILFIAGLLAMVSLKRIYDSNHNQPPESATIRDLSQSPTFSKKSFDHKEPESSKLLEKL
jgi:hypothetical protein